jgi:hypothetical protein
MTSFESGPAHGVTLMLKRQPKLLRVVESADGKFDALDQLTDVPAANEKIHVYLLKKLEGTLHINYGRRGGAWYQMASYVFHSTPPDEIVRTTDAWRSWCMETIQASKSAPIK